MDYEPISSIVGGCSMHNYQVYIRPGNHSIRKVPMLISFHSNSLFGLRVVFRAK